MILYVLVLLTVVWVIYIMTLLVGIINNGLIDNTSTDILVDNENLWITSPYGGLICHLLMEVFWFLILVFLMIGQVIV